MIPFSYPAPRVSQLDAHILDSELTTLLKDQLSSIFRLHTNSRWSFSQHPELWSLILNVIIFKLTVWKSGASYGLSLQNLKLTDFKTGKIIGKSKKLLVLAVLLGTYFFNRIESYLYSIEEGSSDQRTPFGIELFRKVKSKIVDNRTFILSKLDHTFKVLNLVNFTLFLLNGRYPSLTHRILGISLTPIVTDLLKFNGNNVNFEFQNRQLVWNVMTEFLVFTLPLLQLNKLQKSFKRVFSPKKEKKVAGRNLTQFTNLPVSQCAICHENNFKNVIMGLKTPPSSGTVTNPYVTNCGHVYCYVCIATRFNSIKALGEELTCLRCAQKLQWFREFGTDDDEVDQDAILFIGEEVEEEEEEEYDEKVEMNHNRDLPQVPLSSGEEEEDSDFSEEEEYEEDEAFD